MSDDTAPEITHPVARQLDAYNARDIEAFMRWWADDCQYYAFPDTLLANGAEEIRARHITRFLEPVDSKTKCNTQRLCWDCNGTTLQADQPGRTL